MNIDFEALESWFSLLLVEAKDQVKNLRGLSNITIMMSLILSALSIYFTNKIKHKRSIRKSGTV